MLPGVVPPANPSIVGHALRGWPTAQALSAVTMTSFFKGSLLRRVAQDVYCGRWPVRSNQTWP